MRQKFVVAITINYNHSKDTIKCVESICKSVYNNYKIVIVDNGSEVNDYQNLNEYFFKQGKIKIIRLNENKGYVGGVNKGLEEAAKDNPDYFLIMNNDTLIDKEAMGALVETAEKYGRNAIVSGKVYNMDEPDTLQYIGQYTLDEKRLKFPPYIKGEKEKDVGQYEEEMELGMADDIFWLLPKKIFDKVGYYSTDFFLYGEQNDYALRAKKAGFKLIYTPKAKLWHHHHLTTGGTPKGIQRINFWKYYASSLLYYKHMSRITFIKEYLKLISKLSLKIILKFYNKEKMNLIYKPNFLAQLYFIKWLILKTKNDGFNPYN